MVKYAPKLLTDYSLFYDKSSLKKVQQYLKLILSDQSSDNSESDDSSDELPDLEDSDRDSEYSDVDSEDSEDSDEEDLGPEFINFMNIIFGKLKFSVSDLFYRVSHIYMFLFMCNDVIRPKLLIF